MKTIPKKYFKDVPLEVQREEKPHYVYFILAKEGNLKRVKIGKCEKEEGIIKRFSSLNTSSPIDLKIIGYLKGYEKKMSKSKGVILRYLHQNMIVQIFHSI